MSEDASPRDPRSAAPPLVSLGIGIGGGALAIPSWAAPVALILIGLGAIGWSLARQRRDDRSRT